MRKIYLLVLLSIISTTAFSQNYTYTLYHPQNSGIGSANIYDIKFDSNGLMWLATYGALTSFNGTTFTNYTNSNSAIPAVDLRKIAIDSQNRKWIATGENGVILYNGTTWTNYRTTNSGLPDNVINDIAVDASNNVWIATYSGLVKFNGTTWTVYNATNSAIGSNTVNSVATSGNTVYFTGEGTLRKLSGTTFSILGDQANRIRKINGSDIYVDKQQGGFLKYTNEIVSAGVNYDGSCMTDCKMEGLDIDQNGKIWIDYSRECADGGLQNFSDCRNYFPAVAGISFEYTSCLKVQTSNTIWVGTYETGLVKMTASAASTCSAPTNLATSNITSTTATISWTAPSPAPNGYTYMVNETNILGGSPIYTTLTSATLSGLYPNSDYYWWVSTDCGNGQSQWTLGGSFATAVPPPCFVKMANADNHTIAIKGDGSLWGWGENGDHQIGLGDTTDKKVPTQIGNDTNWVAVAASGTHSMALKSDGSLWAWGSNSSGQLGDNTQVDKVVPTRIGTANNWAKIAINQGVSWAIKTDGTLWGWGGAYGFGDSANRLVPTQLGTATYKEVSTGSGHTLAIKTDNTLWAWGWNNNGAVGNNSTTTVIYSPVQVGTSAWQFVEANQANSIGIKTDGTLWGWGFNTDNRIGVGTSVNIKTPTQIGTANNWAKAQMGIGQTVAIKTDGSLWGWGFNTEGELSLGNQNFRSAPTRIGFASDWLEAGAGDRYCIYLKTNGDIYSAGWSPQGQMGLGANAVHTTMVQITCPTTVLASEDFGTAGEMKIYPNPVQNLLNISFDRKITSVSIFNILGQEVITKAIHANESEIEVSALASGTYIVKVVSDDEIKTLKVIKQ